MAHDDISKLTRIRRLEELHRGDEIEARLHAGSDARDVVIRRGSVQDTAPGIGVVWILDSDSGTRKAVHSDECALWRRDSGLSRRPRTG